MKNTNLVNLVILKYRINMLFGVCIMFIWLFAAAEGSDFGSPGVYQLTPPMDHAEGPTWDSRKNILYFVNIHKGELFAYHHDTKLLSKIRLNGDVSPVVPSRKDANLLLVGLNRSVVAVEWDGNKKLGEQELLTTISKEFPRSRFNDGKADMQGRLWWGTIGYETNGVVTPHEAHFYKITSENIENPTIIRKHVSISNGLTWNKANDKLYYIDTPTKKVVEFDYNDKEGTISADNRTIFDVSVYPNITGYPDGMTIDNEDNLYICLYGGGSIVKISAVNGKLLQVIPLPARDVTSAAWGGPNLDILFVTTSSHSLTPLEKLQFPAAGSLFAVKDLNTKGLPAFTADIIDEIPKKLNLLDNIFAPEVFSPKNNNQKNVSARNTERSFWETVMGAIRSIF